MQTAAQSMLSVGHITSTSSDTVVLSCCSNDRYHTTIETNNQTERQTDRYTNRKSNTEEQISTQTDGQTTDIMRNIKSNRCVKSEKNRLQVTGC
jgi:hypothetical protein